MSSLLRLEHKKKKGPWTGLWSSGELGRGKSEKGSLTPFPSLSSLFFFPNREPVHRLTKKIFKSISNSNISLSFFLIWNWNDTDTFIRSRSSLENYTRFQAKMGKVYTRFQTKTAPKLNPMAWHIPIQPTTQGGTPPPPLGTGPMFVTRSSLFLPTFTNS